MRTVPVGASDDELLSVVRDWVELVAAGSFQAAVQLLYLPADDYAAGRWTAESLENYIGNYGFWEPLGDGRVVRVTPLASAVPPADAPDRQPRFEVIRGQGLPNIEFDLPLDGEWSDLTALFDIEEVDGRWAFVLTDLHVR